MVTRADLDSIMAGYDKLGEFSEDYDLPLERGPKLADTNACVNERVKVNPETAQETADRMHEERKLSERIYHLICETVKRRRRAK